MIDSGLLLRYVLYTTAFLPFCYLQSLIFPATTTRAFAFSLIVACSVFLFSYRIFRGYCTLRVTTFHLLFTGLVVVLGLVTVTNTSPLEGIFSSFARMEGVFFWVLILMWLYVTSSSFSLTEWHHFFRLSLFAGVGVSVLVYAQYAGMFPFEDRATILFDNAHYLAFYLIGILWYGCILFFVHEGTMRRIVYGVSNALLVGAISLTGSRGAFVAILSGTLVFGFLYGVRMRKKIYARFYEMWSQRLVRYLLVVVSVVCVGSVGGGLFTHTVLFERISNSLEKPITLEPRYFLWEAALHGIRTEPWGRGLEQYGDVFAQFITIPYFTIPYIELWSDRVHNMYLEIALSGGVGAFILYLSMWYVLMRVLSRTMHTTPFSSLLFSLLVTYLIYNFFAFDTLTSLIFCMSLCAYILLYTRDYTYTVRPYVGYIFGAVSCICMVVAISSVVVRYGYAHNVRDTLASYDPLLFKKSEENIGQLLIHGLPQDREYLRRELLERDLKVPEDLRKYNTVLCSGTISARASYLCALLARHETISLQENLLKEARKDEMHAFIIDLVLARTYLAHEMLPEAEEVLMQYRPFVGVHKELSLLTAVFMVAHGESDAAIALLKEVFGTEVVADPLLVEMYMKYGHVVRAQECISAFLKNNPTDARWWEALVEIQYMRGDKERAERTLARGLTESTLFKKELELFKRTLRDGMPDFSILSLHVRSE